MKLMRAKGTKDINPEEKLKRDYVVSTLKKIFELYGFVPLETPILERYETLSAKFAAGDESDALKETFKLKDQGGRVLGLRYDLTVPLGRFVAMNPQLKMPFKRYQIGKAFRDGPIEKGRVREFWQCDVDTIGVKSMKSDAEILSLVKDAFKALKLDVVIKVNNRKILDSILDYLKIKNKDTVMVSVDKLDKIGVNEVKKELKSKGVNKIDELIKIISVKGSNKDKIKKLDFLDNKEGVDEIKELISYFNDFEFDLSLVRGLSYYTGTVFEVVLKDGKLKCSVAGGGRYDDMIGNFMGKNEIAAVGIAFGLEPIADVVKFDEKTNVKVYCIPIGCYDEALKIVNELRKNGINTDIDLLSKNISKNLDYANKKGIPYVLFIGENELKLGKYKLKDMVSGKEEMLSVKDVVNKLV
ncbi:MAG: histidine--tRNA ligase [Nanoarchaeota archaeon]|nr:histidine--tRNA ligase [Nanoarchaeota archaeon]